MLKVEVAIPGPSMDDAWPPPLLSTPSTPTRSGAFSLSAPTSPSRVAEFYRRFDDEFINGGEERSSGIPFNWEERPGTPKSPKAAGKAVIEDDFAFDFSAELEKASLSADELFDGGKIRPLKPPPGLQLDDSIDQRSPLISPVAKGKKIIREVFSPRRKKLDSDPFAAAAENTRKRAEENGRGRERTSGLTTSSRRRRATRSLSPFRVAQIPWDEEEEEEEEEEDEQKLRDQTDKLNRNSAVSSNSSSSSSSSTSKSSSSKKWRLRDFLLFRSASEGRASDKDRFRKYSYPALFRKHEDVKNSSFRSADSDSGSVSGSRRKGRVSAHELHYKTNKAVSEDLKKKTFLPYKQGILGRFAFNPTVHALR